MNNELKKIVSSIGENRIDKFQVGQTVEVCYKSDDVNCSYLLEQRKTIDLLTKIFGILGGVFVFISVILFIVIRNIS